MTTPTSFLEHLSGAALPLLADGAMGTRLNARLTRDTGFDLCFDALNLTHPDLVMDIHHEYLAAGAQLIQTNTFGANRFKLAAHGLEDKVNEINRAGVELAKRAAANHIAWVAGDIGPLGVRLAPYGRVQPEQARQAFIEQAQPLVDGGVALLSLETFSDLAEILEAIQACQQVCSLPVIASMTFTRDDRTLLGDDPAQVARALAEAGVEVIGVNCSGGPAQIWRILRQMRQAVRGVWLSAKPNAGWPEQVGGRILYPANPDYFGEYALAFCQAGASLVGGCCGTTPQHIAAMRQALDQQSGCLPAESELLMPVELEERAVAGDSPSRMAQKLAQGKFIIAVEMDPPRGLAVEKLLAGASLLAEAGADVINVADSPMARMRMSPWAVCQQLHHSLDIDTTLHFPTRGRNLLRVQGDLLAAHALGIRNLFVVMGDPTTIGDYPEAANNYDLAPSGLVKLIKQHFNLGRDHSGSEIGQPTQFFVGCALNLAPPDAPREIKTLRRKLEAGADFLLTQPVFQPELAEAFLQRYRDEHGELPVPVFAGVLPLYGLRHAAFLHHEVPGISIPEDLQQRLKQAGEQAPAQGVKIALQLIEQMKPWISGIYLMPAFQRYDLAAEVVEGCRNL